MLLDQIGSLLGRLFAHELALLLLDFLFREFAARATGLGTRGVIFALNVALEQPVGLLPGRLLAEGALLPELARSQACRAEGLVLGQVVGFPILPGRGDGSPEVA